MTKNIPKNISYTTLSIIASICTLTFFFFFGIWYSLFIGEFSGLLVLDTLINSTISTLHTTEFSGYLTPFFITISSIFDPIIFLTWFLVLTGILAFFPASPFRFEALFLFCGVAGGQVIKIVIKYLTNRERPENPFGLSAHESSFPSGHATTAVFFFLSILYLFTGKLPSHKRIFSRIFLVLMALLVPISRMYEQVHYFSDVVAGSLLGIFSLCFTLLFFRGVEIYFPEIYKKIIH